MLAGNVVRSKVTWDTWSPRDMRAGEIAYVADVEAGGTIGCVGYVWLHLISLERPGKCFTIMLPGRRRRRRRSRAPGPERWFEVLA